MEIRFTYIVVHFVMMTRASSLLEILSGESLGPRPPPPPPRASGDCLKRAES